MATYNGYIGKRRVMSNITEDQKVSMGQNPIYKNITFKAIPGSDIAPVGVDKKVKPAPAPEQKHEGAQDAQEK